MKTLLQQEEQITDGFQHHFFTFDLLSNPLLLYSVLLHTFLIKEKYNLQDPAFIFFCVQFDQQRYKLSRKLLVWMTNYVFSWGLSLGSPPSGIHHKVLQTASHTPTNPTFSDNI